MSNKASYLLLAVLLVAAVVVPQWTYDVMANDEFPPGESFAERCGDNDGRHGLSIHLEITDADHHARLRRGGCKLDIEMDGKIEFAPDESEVVAMGRRARLEIEERYGFARRKLVVTPGKDGKPRYEVEVGGEEVPFDDEARAWMADVLPELFRAAGIDAEGRVGRFLERGGAQAVFEEIPHLASDHLKRLYLVALGEQATLDATESERYLTLAGHEIDSDYELAELLIAAVGDGGIPASGQAFVETATLIGSDFELRRVLHGTLEKGDVEPEAAESVLVAAREIGSDYELAKLLLALTEALPRGASLPPGFFDTASSIGSDFELRRVLTTVAERRSLTPKSLESLLVTSRAIDSDHELAELLIVLLRSQELAPELEATFEETAGSIGSDYERERVETARRRG